MKTKHPIVVTNWTNEEGTRYAPPMLSSGVFAGVHTQEWAYELTDADGKKFGDELPATKQAIARQQRFLQYRGFAIEHIRAAMRRDAVAPSEC